MAIIVIVEVLKGNVVVHHIVSLVLLVLELLTTLAVPQVSDW